MPACPQCGQTVSDEAKFCDQCGASLTAIQQSELSVRIRQLLAEDRKIEAIRVLREATGVGLAEAKHFVESVETESRPAFDRSPKNGSMDAADSELVEILRLQGKIAAIKRHRELTGVGLRESKEFIERLGSQHGVVPQASGCLTTILLGFSITMGIAAAMTQI